MFEMEKQEKGREGAIWGGSGGRWVRGATLAMRHLGRHFVGATIL